MIVELLVLVLMVGIVYAGALISQYFRRRPRGRRPDGRRPRGCRPNGLMAPARLPAMLAASATGFTELLRLNRGPQKRWSVTRRAEAGLAETGLADTGQAETGRTETGQVGDKLYDTSETWPESWPESKAESTPTMQAALVLQVLSGDTLIVSTLFRQFTVGLDALDAPEPDQHWGDCSRFGLGKLVAGKRVYLQIQGKDKYRRKLATVFVNAGDMNTGARNTGARNTGAMNTGYRGLDNLVDVNVCMVASGHAWVRPTCTGHLSDQRREQLERKQAWARSRKLGLWQSHIPVPPWKWKHSD